MNPSRTAHVVVVGGAIMGSFTAWALRQAGHTGRITVLEQDPSYQRSSTALSAASIRTQFGTPVNIAMSLYAAGLFRRIKTVFGPDADVGYQEKGYLILGTPEQTRQQRAGAAMQRACGADIAELEPHEVAQRFPGLNTGDLGLGTLGLQHEGWFDAWSLLSLVKAAARGLGVDYVHATVTGFQTHGPQVTAVRLAPDDTLLPCDVCVLAAGPASGRLAVSLGIALPVVPRKRTVFSFRTPYSLPHFPMLFDTSGLWVRPEGQGFIGGIQPPASEDPDADGDFEPQHHLLEDVFWPALAARIPAMEELRLQHAWAGHYEVNTLDHNGVVGPHDEWNNLIFATGFSGHGVMHAPAVGRGVAELITAGAYRSIDLSPLGWARIRTGTPLVEHIVY